MTAKLQLLCGLVLCAATAAAGAATPHSDLPNVTVHFSRQDLASDEGARAVYHRIVTAAESVCPLQPGRPFVTAPIQACRDQAISHALQDIGSARLVALHVTSANRG